MACCNSRLCKLLYTTQSRLAVNTRQCGKHYANEIVLYVFYCSCPIVTYTTRNTVQSPLYCTNDEGGGFRCEPASERTLHQSRACNHLSYTAACYEVK